MEITSTQEEFVSRFRAYMAKAGAYDALSGYIKGLQPKDLRECLAIYFDVSKDYRGKEEHKRSLTVFYSVSLLAVQKNDEYFALRFDALTQAANTDWQKTYSELDSTQKRKLSAQIAQQKTKLSWTQRGFLGEFDRHMKQPNQKAVSEYTAKLKKTDQLFDCLRVYVEASQKYPDNDKNSLIIFFGVSFQALGLGDSYFAAKYESLVTSKDTIWKRRYDALDTWQRDEKLKPAIAEKKKISVEKTGNVKVKGVEKELVAQEKYTVPALPHAPPDLEGPRPTPPRTENQRKFVADFKKFMDSPDAKPAEFTNKIFNLTGPQLVECVEAYLEASLPYGDNNERSLYIFFGTASLAIRKADAYYSFKFSSGIKTEKTLLAKRFAALNTEQQKVLKNDIEIKKKLARVLDDLKLAYFQKEKKEPTLQALRNFEALKNPEQLSLLSYALDRCNRTFNRYNADDFSTAFEALSTLVLAQKDLLLSIVLLKRCREAKEVDLTLRHQLYWYMVGLLYIQALVARPEAYKAGFSDEEKQFLFDATDAADPYFADFAIRLDYLWQHHAGNEQLKQTVKAYIQIMLFAAKIGALLVPMVEMAAVKGLVKELREKKPSPLDEIQIPINSRYNRGKTLQINQTIGHIFIVWWEPNLGAYIEHEGFEGILFRVDSYDWLGRVYDNDAVWGEIYRRTSYLLVLIPFVFELLGYLPDLVTGGVTGLAKSIFINIAIEKAVEEWGLNSNVVQLALLGAGLLTHHALSEKKGSSASGKLIEDTGAANRSIDPLPASSGGGAGHGGTQGRMADYDPRGIALGEGNVTGVHEPLPVETLTADRHIDPNVSGGGAHGGSTAKPTSVPDVPPATRQDLVRAEGELRNAEQRFKDAAGTLENAEKQVGNLESLVEEQGKDASAELKERLAEAEKTEKDIRSRYNKRESELKTAKSEVDRLTKDLTKRGELQPALRIEWNLPDKPVTFRYKGVEAKSWRPDAYVGTSDNRQIVERLLNENPNGELGKRLLNNGKLFPADVGDMNLWKAHPEMIELAHVLSKREKGRDVYIIMTKSRNRTFGARIEGTGGVFKEDAIVLQGMAIDKLSAIQLGVPQSVIDSAPIITFAK